MAVGNGEQRNLDDFFVVNRGISRIDPRNLAKFSAAKCGPYCLPTLNTTYLFLSRLLRIQSADIFPGFKSLSMYWSRSQSTGARGRAVLMLAYASPPDERSLAVSAVPKRIREISSFDSANIWTHTHTQHIQYDH